MGGAIRGDAIHMVMYYDDRGVDNQAWGIKSEDLEAFLY